MIVILGVLAASALPRFASLGSDARAVSLRAAKGALMSAVVMVRAKALVSNNMANGTIRLDGHSVIVRNGYPAAGDLGEARLFSAAAGLGMGVSAGDDYDIRFENGGLTVSPKNVSMASRASCSFTYVQAAADTPPSYLEQTSNGKYVCN